MPEFLEIAANIPLLVSVRSGILDLVVKTNVNMLVLYSDKTIDKARYSLKAWKCKGKITELTFDEVLNEGKFELFDGFIQSIRG